MQKRSVLNTILVLVLLALIIPAMSGETLYCWPPTCIDSCPDGTYDCTASWAISSWSTFYAYMGLWWNGYTSLVCCTP